MALRLARMGWSNLWRNPRRTAITVTALSLGIVALAFTVSLMEGLTRDLIESGTGLLLGHVQIHAQGYRPDRSIFDTIPGDGRAWTVRIRAGDRAVLGAAPRAIGYGLVSAGEHSAGAELLGVVPEAEARVSTLLEHVVAGRALAGERSGEVLLGVALARALGVEPGASVVVLTQAADGSLGNEVYRVAGLLETGVEAVDAGLLVAGLADVQEILALGPERVHEIALRTGSPAQAPETASRLASRLGGDDLEVAAWPELAPEIGGWVAMSEGWNWITYAIILTLAAVAVLNTMLMAVFERFREFGVLAAMGMRPGHVVALVTWEVASLAAVGLVAAAALGFPLLSWLVHTGIDLSAITSGLTMSGVALAPVMRGVWTPFHFALSALLLVAFALVAGLYPAVKAARVDPALLTRGELR